MARVSVSRRSLLLGAVPAIGLRTVPARAQSPALNFVVIGDWGRDGCCHQTTVAEQMARSAVEIRSSFVISVGDNFYENGVSSIHDPQWKTSFEDIYTRPGLMTRWHVILGNHDYQRTGRPEAQIAYSSIDPRWSLPSFYYQRSEHLPDGTTADFFFLDTSSYIQHYYKPGSDVHVDRAQQEPQIKWLERGLATSQAAWKIVVGHHQVYAATNPGDYVGDDMIRWFKPLLDRYGVHIYINGHEHNLQHIMQDGVHYITCGAGSQTFPVQAAPGQFASGRQGFMTMRLEKDTLGFSLIDDQGTTLYRANIPRQI
ncbi:MAG TPA: tartrate-resistant acid phosphatase type 5 family protein [Acetobacteraceae bacterium]|nr:tartrate-resistant acid phosphatase type 5 family protein [Acetobacteraceae bacterium]